MAHIEARQPAWLAAHEHLVYRLGLVLGLLTMGLFLLTLGLDIMQADGVRSPVLTIVGGDYLAIDTAGDAFRHGQAAVPYDAAWLKDELTWRSGVTEPGMMWQYPPAYYFLIAPFSAMPYLAGYALWLAAGMLVFAGAAWLQGFRWQALTLMLATPATMIVINQGQGSFLTAALLITAAAFSGKRPVLAGVAAGLLTVKPQLGLLLPVAYIAAGHWRAFGVAAATALGLSLLSVMVMGVGIWAEFFDAVLRIEQDFTGGGADTPVRGMTTPLSALLLAGVPAGIAKAVHCAAALVLAWIVGFVWRRGIAADLGAALLCTAALLVTPYAYNYELVILAYPCAVLVRYGMRDGWLAGELEAIVAGWFILLLSRSWPLADHIQTGFVLSLIILCLVFRRCSRAEAEGSSSASMTG